MKKKFLSMLFAVMMVFTMSTAVFAEDEVDTIPPPDYGTQVGPDADQQSYKGEWTCDPTGKCGYTNPDYLSGYTLLGTDFFYFTSWTIGEWDTQVSDMTFSSTGGYFKINARGQSVDGYQTGTTPVMEVELWEDDGTTGDDHVKTWTIYPKTYDQYLTANVAGHTDGLNGKAELYLKVRNNYSVSGDKGYFRMYD